MSPTLGIAASEIISGRAVRGFPNGCRHRVPLPRGNRCGRHEVVVRQKYELPNERAFVDGPVIHHFDEHSWRGVRPRRRGPDGQPIGEDLKRNPLDIVKAEPLDECYLGTEGGGAESTPGYLGLDGVDADSFYAESAPIWWTPARMFDLRDTWTTFYLKEVKPISVALGYEPHLFVAAYLPDNHPPRVR